MSYDDTKLKIAIKKWLKKSCRMGYGEESSGNLLASFEDYLYLSCALKRSPGRVVFGQQLKALGLERRRVAGITYWAGMALKKLPEIPAETHYKKTEETLEQRVTENRDASRANAEQKIKDKKQRKTEFKQQISRETAESVRAVGGEISTSD